MRPKLSSIAVCCAALAAGCSSRPSLQRPDFQARESDLTIGGRKVVTLSQPRVINPHNPQFLSAQILPGRGMNIFQIKAHLPVQGEISLIESPQVEEAARLMNGGPEDAYFSQSFSMGGAILVPFANRIRGKLSPDRKTLETKILDKTVRLDANWSGKKPGAEPHAMHGLILGSPMDKATLDTSPNEASVTGSLDAGDFGGHWLSKTALTIKATLHINAFRLDVTAQNTGTEDLPIGIGWHPYFVLPSGDREQARLRIPARQRALVNNYDDVFPTGELVAVGDTSYDFNMPGGARLGKMFLDDCFVDLQRNTEGHATADIIDPKGGYGLRIRALSPEISAFQAYAPPDKKFVAFEPQFNWADPYSKIWQGKDTGMKVLKPGESVTYSVQLELYVP